MDELTNSCKKLKMGKCPGPDGIPNEVLKIVSETWPELLLNTYNLCLQNGKFPDKWKVQKLVLLRKGEKPLDQPSSYRPLCMLNSLGKLFEYLLLHRLTKCVEEHGSLSPNQYGFRNGRCTVDAINEVVEKAKRAQINKGFCAIITLDVRNAFNTAKWSVILDSLRHKGIHDYLYNMIADYLSNRILLYETDNGMERYQVTAGVPQGPFLWNVMYDGILNMKLPKGAKLIGYADDIALVVTQPTADLITIVTNDCLSRCNRWLKANGLQLAVAKTEAILVTSRRIFTRPKFSLQCSNLELKRHLCYLGVQLDDKLSFREHIENIRNKALKTATSLARIMPNCGGPKPYIRKLINGVAHSQILYAAPIFAAVMKQKSRLRELQKPQRISALRIISAYRTVSTPAALVIAGLPPIDLQLDEREEIYRQLKQTEGSNSSSIELKRLKTQIQQNARTNTLIKWQERWSNEEKGRWTYHLIPNIREWIERTHGNVGFYLTQFLTNHGSFNHYLHRFKLKDTACCETCGASDETVEHLLFECPKWNQERQVLNNRIGESTTIENIMKYMLRSEEYWRYCEEYINKVIKDRCSVVPNLPR